MADSKESARGIGQFKIATFSHLSCTMYNTVIKNILAQWKSGLGSWLIFDQQLKLHLGLDAEPEIQILKVIYIVYTSLTGISNEFLNCGGEFMTLASKPKAKRTTFCLSSHLTIKENTNYFCAFKKYLCSQRSNRGNQRSCPMRWAPSVEILNYFNIAFILSTFLKCNLMIFRGGPPF